MTKLTLKQILTLSTKAIAEGKDPEVIVKSTLNLLFKEGYKSFDMFSIREPQSTSLYAKFVEIIYKHMCKAESFVHDKKTAAVRRAAVEHPASSTQIRRRQIEDQNMIFAMHHQF